MEISINGGSKEKSHSAIENPNQWQASAATQIKQNCRSCKWKEEGITWRWSVEGHLSCMGRAKAIVAKERSGMGFREEKTRRRSSSHACQCLSSENVCVQLPKWEAIKEGRKRSLGCQARGRGKEEGLDWEVRQNWIVRNGKVNNKWRRNIVGLGGDSNRDSSLGLGVLVSFCFLAAELPQTTQLAVVVQFNSNQLRGETPHFFGGSWLFVPTNSRVLSPNCFCGSSLMAIAFFSLSSPTYSSPNPSNCCIQYWLLW